MGCSERLLVEDGDAEGVAVDLALRRCHGTPDRAPEYEDEFQNPEDDGERDEEESEEAHPGHNIEEEEGKRVVEGSCGCLSYESALVFLEHPDE